MNTVRSLIELEAKMKSQIEFKNTVLIYYMYSSLCLLIPYS